MKKLVVFFLCFFPSNAFASSADSGKCPWKIPFTIQIFSAGIVSSYEEIIPTHGSSQIINQSNTPDSSAGFTFTVDSSVGSYSLSNDTLRYSYSYYDSDYQSTNSEYVVIAFAQKEDSIISLNAQEEVYIQGQPQGREGLNEQSSFIIYSLIFNDTLIYSTDSAFNKHRISYSNEELRSLYTEPNSIVFGQFYYSNFTASSVTLSGIFRTTTFSEPAIVTKTPQPNNLAIYSSNGSIACSFDVSDHAKDLEIFSPLGIREASFTIPAGQMEASLPHLPAGFYFVRLDGAMAKVYISD
jgi:hypothetical protein